MKEDLNNLEGAINTFAAGFAVKYFGKYPESWWVADEVGGILFVNDYFFNLKDMIDFVKYRYTRKKMFEYYDYALGIASGDEGDYKINIKNWIKLK